ncbi:MAG: phosphonopyruvate decarboxylase [Polyangiales bacterium]
MLDCKQLYQAFESSGITFFAGVPDSLLKDFCAYVTDHTADESNVITANEGGAVALAAGYHLATGKFACVYMQNSGLGNTVNPLTSLADPEVYAIPMLLVIGWRGEPGKKDEPQHVKIGRVQPALLSALEVAGEVLPDDIEAARAALGRAIAYMTEKNAPYALLVKAGTFDKYKLEKKRPVPYAMTREEAIGVFADHAKGAVVVSTTGMPSRELFEHRVKNGQDRSGDFLTVGSMGHASQIALGIALAKPNEKVYCLDGDGAVIMHMGGLSTIGTLAPKNYKHVVLNNGAHDSVGGQPTVGFDIDFGSIARACGYKHVFQATTRQELETKLAELANVEGPALLEVRVKTGARADLGRPTATPRESKDLFAKRLRG